jgi:hypothetical protein
VKTLITPLTSNWIVSAPVWVLASRIACRSEPEPLSLRLATWKVDGTVRSSNGSSVKRASWQRVPFEAWRRRQPRLDCGTRRVRIFVQKGIMVGLLRTYGLR